MEMAVVQLGGHPVYIQKEEVGLGTRESAEDVARTLACYHAIIAARVMDHRDLGAMAGGDRHAGAQHALRPRPSAAGARRPADGQAAARPARRRAHRLCRRRDNNVCRSLAEACSLLGVELTLASPEGYGLGDAPDGVTPGRRSGRGGRGRRNRLHRRLGVDGPGRRERGADAGLRRPTGSTRR